MKIEAELFQQSVSRRHVLKMGGLGGLAVVSAGLNLPFSYAAQTSTRSTSTEKVVWSACTVNCGSRCPLRLHVVNGEVTYVETDNTGSDNYAELPQIRACLRGRSMRRRIYHPDRLKYPMKRVGKRGEGKFERISWGEAYDILASNLQRIIKEYGNEAIYLNYGTGALGGTIAKSWPPRSTLIARLMNCCGGYLNHYGDYSTAQIAAGLSYTYGGWAAGNSLSDVANTKLVVMFGNNPAETRMSGGGLTYHYSQGLEQSKARVVIIDPRYTDTACGREDEWLPIRPGTDAALAAALAYVLITENMVDQPFLDTYCVGYDEKTLPEGAPRNSHYKAYILGDGDDQTAKTPAWAEAITGISATKIIQLAREIGQAKPAYISQGWGPQRHANGELTSRAIAMLPILTGNVGISGGNSGARESSYNIPFVRMPTLTNPVSTSISMFLWTDAIYRAHEMTATTDGVRGKEKLDVPIKFVWNYASNCVINQHSDINRTHQILQDDSLCEMIVVIDNHMTPSAKYADILLPDCTTSEQMDFCMDAHSGNTNSVIFADQAIEPRFEFQDIYTMMSNLAERLGVKEQFTEGRTREEWLKHLYELSRKNLPELPTFDQFRQQGIFKKRDPAGHVIAYKAFRDNPQANPLTTPSGKIEIYSQSLAKIAETWQLADGDVISPLPVYAAGFNGWQDQQRESYPLQLVGFHYKARTHSTYGNIAVLQQACRQEVWLNPIDAESRGIKQGDMVRVFNQHGEIRLSAKVTPRIMPGVSGMGQGAWHQADMLGDKVDHGGCVNTLTTLRPSPLAKGNPQHSNLVQIEKV